jgi:uncharacterized protein
MRGKIKYFIAIIFILDIVIFMMNRISNKNSQPYVRINSLEIPVEVAADAISRVKGLSGRTSLDEGSGMLFIFDKPGIYSFWMPDMNFPIDIIWINDAKVVDISKNVPNDFSLLNFRAYKPSQPSQYVLEVNAGFAEKENIKIGDAVSLP